jgi:hypothetical protein
VATRTLRIGRGRSRAYVALTALGFLAVGLLLTESFLQLRWTPPSALSTHAFGSHPLYVSAPLPGVRGEQACNEYRTSFEHSLLGFRGALPDLEPKGERKRLLVVGDSQTYGLGCNEGETFCDELRSSLPDVDVLNAGCNGYGTNDSLAIVHHFGEAWKPDVVLLVFFWNDLEDNVKHPRPTFELSAAGEVQRVDAYAEDFGALQLRPAQSSQPPGVSGLLLPRFFKEGLRGVRYRLFGIRKRKLRSDEDMQAAWGVTDELLGLLAQRCRELDCELIIASLPDHNQVDPAAVIRNIDPINYEVQDELFARCSALSIATIDLLPPLGSRFEETGRSLYYYADRHLKPEGHKVVGEHLTEKLAPLFE